MSELHTDIVTFDICLVIILLFQYCYVICNVNVAISIVRAITEYERLVVVLIGLRLQRRCRGYVGRLHLERSLDLDRHLPVSRKPRVFCRWLTGKYKPVVSTINDIQFFPIAESTVFHTHANVHMLISSNKKTRTKVSYFILLFFHLLFITYRVLFRIELLPVAITFHCSSLLRE